MPIAGMPASILAASHSPLEQMTTPAKGPMSTRAPGAIDLSSSGSTGPGAEPAAPGTPSLPRSSRSTPGQPCQEASRSQQLTVCVEPMAAGRSRVLMAISASDAWGPRMEKHVQPGSGEISSLTLILYLSRRSLTLGPYPSSTTTSTWSCADRTRPT